MTRECYEHETWISTKLYKKNTAVSKNMTMASYRQSMTSMSFLQIHFD